MPKTVTLKFRAINRDIFEAIVSGKKKVETRAGTDKYRSLVKGDVITLSCGSKKIKKIIGKVEHFASIPLLVKKHRPKNINPMCTSEEELTRMYYSFPRYEEKIREHGILAITLKAYANSKN